MFSHPEKLNKSKSKHNQNFLFLELFHKSKILNHLNETLGNITPLEIMQGVNSYIYVTEIMLRSLKGNDPNANILCM